MSEQERPKRRFWQFHLSTAVIAIFITGIFLGLSIISVRDGREMAMFGFPYIALFPPSSWRNDYTPATGWEVMSWPGLLIDLMIFVTCLFAAVSISEWLAHRQPAPGAYVMGLVLFFHKH